MSTPDIELVSVTKLYGDTLVVDSIDITIPRGEFVSILGPSGCGKTTTLNMIAGFQEPTSGQVRIRGANQQGVPPEKRNIGLVFQNYALFPHMTVAQNIAFGLKMKKAGRAETDAAVRSALKSVHLDGLEDRYPKELSGGQQQRTALARAIAPRPSVLLLDEPLSNLDLKLREAMRVELKEIQRALEMTFVYVTHDQEEAMAMSDRIVVMSRGVVAQEGDPASIYNRPRTSFVADFIGKSNILPISTVRQGEAAPQLVLPGGVVLAIDPAEPVEERRFCCIRPEDVRIRGLDGAAAGRAANLIDGRVAKIVNLGAHLDVWVEVAEGVTLKALLRTADAGGLQPGSDVTLAIGPEAIRTLAE